MGARFRPCVDVGRGKGASAGSPAVTLRTSPAPRPRVAARRTFGRDAMSSKEGGVSTALGVIYSEGLGCPAFWSDFPLLTEGCPPPLQARGEGRRPW